MNAAAPFAAAELVLAGFIRIVTNRSIFSVPTPLDVAIATTRTILDRPNCVPTNPGRQHFEIFTDLCRSGSAIGNLAADAYLAAIAIEHACRWVTFDRDFARFPGLKWTTPAEP